MKIFLLFNLLRSTGIENKLEKLRDEAIARRYVHNTARVVMRPLGFSHWRTRCVAIFACVVAILLLLSSISRHQVLVEEAPSFTRPPSTGIPFFDANQFTERYLDNDYLFCKLPAWAHCLTPSQFHRKVEEGYPIQPSLAKKNQCDIRKLWYGRRTAIILRGFLFKKDYPTAHSFRSRGVPYTIDIRKTYPSLYKHILEPLRGDGGEYDLFVITPYDSDQSHVHWITNASNAVVFQFKDATSQFSWLGDALKAFKDYTVSANLAYGRVWLLRSDLMFGHASYRIFDCNSSPDTISIASRDFMNKPMDVLHLFPSWALFEQFSNTMLKNRGADTLHYGLGAFQLHSLLEGCHRQTDLCCNKLFAIYRGEQSTFAPSLESCGQQFNAPKHYNQSIHVACRIETPKRPQSQFEGDHNTLKLKCNPW